MSNTVVIAVGALSCVAILLAAYIATLLLRPQSGARLGASIGKSSFMIETKDPPTLWISVQGGIGWTRRSTYVA